MNIDPCMSVEMNQRLFQDLMHDEVKVATFSLGGHKALGFHGFSGAFFHS